MTQPTFSRRIKSLENWLGVELVDRSVYPIQLTAVGREFMGPLQENLRHPHSRLFVTQCAAMSGFTIGSGSSGQLFFRLILCPPADTVYLPALDAELELSAETALTEAMKSMVLQGMGMAWLPHSLICNELESGALLKVTVLPDMTMGIRRYRFINAPSALAQQFWSRLVLPAQE